ncbi:MAG TPA: hypothetical protein VII89_06730 [Candidatus Dormibacteraeota bacterium]
MKPLLVLIGLLLAACGSAPQSHFGPVMDRATLIDALRTRVAVDITGTLAQPFLHPQSGTTVRLSGGGLAGPADAQLFEYSTAAAAADDAHQIRADGSGNSNTIVDWVAPPHLFLKGRVLVIYVGNDPGVVSLLSNLLGSQFAGVI